jgi:hypothetical protein
MTAGTSALSLKTTATTKFRRRDYRLTHSTTLSWFPFATLKVPLLPQQRYRCRRRELIHTLASWPPVSSHLNGEKGLATLNHFANLFATQAPVQVPFDTAAPAEGANSLVDNARHYHINSSCRRIK